MLKVLIVADSFTISPISKKGPNTQDTLLKIAWYKLVNVYQIIYDVNSEFIINNLVKARLN